MSANTQTLAEHLQELRRRVIWTVLTLICGMGVGYWLHQPIIGFIEHPLGKQLYYSSPAGGFNFVLQSSLLVGVVAALPVLAYNLLRYFEPAVSKRRAGNKTVGFVVITSTLLALAGIAFAYVAAIPLSLHFFGNFNSADIQPLISAKEYMSFVMGCFITFAIIFQLPLVIGTINHIRPFPPNTLSRYRKHVLVASLALAILLPFAFDPASQLILAAPTVALYEVAVLTVWVANRNRVKRVVRRNVKRPAQIRTTPEPEPLPTPLEPTPVKPVKHRRPNQLDGSRPIQLG